MVPTPRERELAENALNLIKKLPDESVKSAIHGAHQLEMFKTKPKTAFGALKEEELAKARSEIQGERSKAEAEIRQEGRARYAYKRSSDTF